MLIPLSAANSVRHMQLRSWLRCDDSPIMMFVQYSKVSTEIMILHHICSFKSFLLVPMDKSYRLLPLNLKVRFIKIIKEPELGALLFNFLILSLVFFLADGLYVLVRPEKKRKNMSAAAVLAASEARMPAHLSHLVMKTLPPETCPWSLSGPQFPQPTAIQQRYCYPKGDPDYSGRKGGALWTMYGRNGKEDLQFRLLHVYFSAKRAVNKGVTLSEEDRQKQQLQEEVAAMTPKKKRLRVSRMIRSPWQERRDNYCENESNFMSYRESNRPLSTLDEMSIWQPPSPCTTEREGIADNGGPAFISPNAASTTDSHVGSNTCETTMMFDHSPFDSVPSFDMEEESVKSESPPNHHMFPFRNVDSSARASSSLLRSSSIGSDHIEELVLSGKPAMLLEGNGGSHLESLFWNDSLLALNHNNPSFESRPESPTVATTTFPQPPPPQPLQTARPEAATSMQNLKSRLYDLHERIRLGILSHPLSEQRALVSLVASWARNVATSPLALATNDKENHDNDQNDGHEHMEKSKDDGNNDDERDAPQPRSFVSVEV